MSWATKPLNPIHVDNLIGLYNGASESQVVAGMAWYDIARDLCHEWAYESGMPFVRVAAIMAIASKQTEWNANCAYARTSVMTRIATHWGPNEQVKMQAIIDGGRIADYVKGPKVWSFFMNILGLDNVVTIDSHMRNATGLKMQVNPFTYSYFSRCLAIATAIINDQRTSNNLLPLSWVQVQAIIWTVFRELKESDRPNYVTLAAA